MESPNFDLDIETLLEAKIGYHKEQMKFHAKMAAETRRKLDLLTEKLNPQVDMAKEKLTQLNFEAITSNIINKSTVDSPLVRIGASLLPLNQNFSVTYWKPLVERVLRDNPRTFKTEDILREIDSRYLDNDELRKRAIASISSSLFALVQNNKVRKIENEGNRGNLYIINH
jgi:hypothetical protein